MQSSEIGQRLFTPKSIAVVGASADENKMGNRFVKHLVDGYPGKLYLIHPRPQIICGIPTLQSIVDIPGEIDLLIPLIPAEQVFPLVESCRRGQVHVLLCIPSGYGEVPGQGKEAEQKLISLAKDRGMRIVGPNSLGVFNSPYRMNASMVPLLPPGDRGLSIITQSGGFGMAVYLYAHEHELEMSKLCDAGNCADISIHDLMNYVRQDNETEVVGLYLESLVDQDRFLQEVRELAARKPVILNRLGKSEAGRRAVLAHVGLLAADPGPEAKLESSHVILSETGQELLDVAKGLMWQPLPRGRRVGIITGSGGIGAELVDLCTRYGLQVPKLSRELQEALRPHLPAFASTANPVDLTPLWEQFPEIYPPLLRALLASDEIDILIATIIDVATTIDRLMPTVKEAVASAARQTAAPKPVYIYWASAHAMRENRQVLQQGHIPCFLTTLAVARVASLVSDYSLKAGT